MNGIPYIIEVQLCLAVFWLVYRFFMRGSRVFGHNRAYLLGSVALAFVIPALSIPVWSVASQPIGTFDIGALQVSIVENDRPQGIDWQAIAKWIYAVGVLVMGVGVGRQVWKMVCILYRVHTQKAGTTRIVSDPSVRSPYSFFRFIFVGSESENPDNWPRIVAHEMAHVRLGHSYDAVFAQLLLIAFWWNPFVWLWNRSLKEVHEYQADSAVLNLGFDAKQYIHLLIGTLADMHPEFVSGFSYSLLKNRLLMMTKPVNSRRSGFRILAAAPVAAGLMGLFSFTEKAPVSAEINTESTINEAVIEIQQPPVDDVFMRVEKMPTFEGGNEGAFRNWVMARIKYPPIAVMQKVEGRVIVSFIVEKDGAVSTVTVDKSPDASLGAEVVRVVRTSPKWTPGTQRGQTVRVKFTLPIDFSLQTSGTTKIFADTVKIEKKSASDAKITIWRSGEQGGPDPLIVVGGKKMPAYFDLKNIDPETIESISVLKDESATQIYGEEAKDGVILIKTKE